MAFVTFPTLTDGQVLTGAHMQIVRDNFAETSPAKATTAGRFMVVTGANSIAERAITGATVGTSETTISTSYTDLATPGPSVTVTTGLQALAFYTAQINNNTASASSLASVAVSGATTTGSADGVCLTQEPGAGSADVTCARIHLFPLTAGSNVFKMEYRVISNTGTFLRRELIVMGL